MYDGEQLLCEVDGSGTDAGEVRATSWWGADGLISRSYSPAGGGGYDRSYVWDTRGNIALQRGGGGSILQRTGGDAFGATGGSSDEPVATFAGQVGGYRDSETGLVLFGQRYYEPGTGSWITRDPVAEEGGINLYSYVKGNPTNFVDEDGLKPKKHSRLPISTLQKYFSVTGTPQQTKRVWNSLGIISKTNTGRKLINLLKSKNAVAEIRCNNIGLNQFVGNLGIDGYVDINLNPALQPKVLVQKGKKKYYEKFTIDVVIVHELGHRVGGINDVGANNMDNVNAWENPYRLEWGAAKRIKY